MTKEELDAFRRLRYAVECFEGWWQREGRLQPYSLPPLELHMLLEALALSKSVDLKQEP